MRQHAGVFAANFSSNLLWQNCFAPKKSAFCAEPRRAAAGILDVCQGGATTGLRETRLLRRMFSYARRPNGRSFFVYGTAGRCGISPYGRFAAPLCRAGPACPAGINAYCAAGHMGPALRIILRPLRCRVSPTGGRKGGRPCPPRVTAHFPPGRCGHRPLRIHPPVMRCRGRRPRRPASAKRCHSEPVTVSLAWGSVPLVPYLLTTSRPSDQTETMLCRCVM